MICLPKDIASRFLSAIEKGELNPGALAEMESSEARHAALAKVVGEGNAKAVNALLESKLLLKNQQAGIERWIKSVGGVTPQAQRDLLTRVSKMDRLLNPQEEKAFLKDLAEQKLGVDVSVQEAEHISKLAHQAQTTKSIAERIVNREGYDPNLETAEEFSARSAYGASKVAFERYVADLKLQAKGNIFQEAGLNPLVYASKIGGISKALKATGDLSFLLRQGWKMFWDHPVVWAKGAGVAVESFGKQLFKKATSNEIIDGVLSDVLSRKNALNGYQRRAGLALGTTEEAIPTSLPERVPGLGRIFKASEVAFEAPAYRMRADLFDQMIDTAEKSGVEINDDTLKGIGRFVNSSTGRGDLGQFEKVAGGVNNLFFSARFFKSDLDLLGQVVTGAGGGNFIRKQAAQRLVKAILGTAAVLKVSDMINPGSVEWDPRSSDFGKIKIGSTRFDVTAGVASIVTLAARLITQESKSSVSGKVTKLDQQKNGVPVYGAPTTEGVVGEFALNKVAPILSTALALRKGFDSHTGKPVNLTSVEGVTNLVKSGFEPLPAANVEEVLNSSDAAPLLAAIIADALGISTNTYGK